MATKNKRRSVSKSGNHKSRTKARPVVARSRRIARTSRPAPKTRSVRHVSTAPRSTRKALKAHARAIVKAAAVVAAVPVQKAARKPKPAAMQKALNRMAARTTPIPPRPRPSRRLEASRPARPAAPARTVNRQLLRIVAAQQYNYMRAPGLDTGFEVGDTVEVFCDHELDSERVRGWLKGVVVQVDNKLVAVQFRTNVFLTDGWMVPDRILWYSLTSDQIRAAGAGKKAASRAIPEY